ncbi:MAG: phosphoribosylaminoimidazolesuccinocarboxamide synthase, partial [Candidatus Kapabacteria bacterium]|nr:phosphoribosylaminoimidazolesuccinocarboxamide synthase [Candidatus Kapabacteria bacterium]
LIIYGLISVWVLYFSYSSYLNGKIVLPLFLGLTAVGLIVAIIKSLNNSATPIIQRDKIISVKFKNEIVRVTRSRFEVLFENEKHKIKKRLIMLPGSMNDGTNETIKALEIMREEGLID